jgi:regulator of sigma E protease
MSWVLTVAGFAALIILHELGHFATAKAVGMRVERFSLFFGPMVAKVRRGETVYGIGVIPLGGYVKITGMNPNEDIPPDVRPRAYYLQPVWKRIVVILAGPVMNVILAFLILWGLYMIGGTPKATSRVDKQGLEPPASQVLRPGDEIVSVDGRRGSLTALSKQISSHHCAGTPRSGCEATTPVRLVVRRAGRLLTLTVRPRYDPQFKRTRIGFAFGVRWQRAGALHAADLSVTAMWGVTRATFSALARIFDAKQRKQISSVVGASKVTQESFNHDTRQAFVVLAIISLSLAIINLFPFLPLDGGHVFWALAEKVRGRPIPFEVLERASVVGFMLVILLFFIGLSNDIDRLRGEGFRVR